MLHTTLSAPADRKMLSGARTTAAIMLFFLILFAAAALALGNAASSLKSGNRITVQIVEANPDSRARQTERALATLRAEREVVSAKTVEEEEMKRLLEPWLGKGALGGDIPIPSMIDVELSAAGRSDLDRIESRIRGSAPQARVDRHDQWLTSLRRLIDSLALLALLMAGLAGGAMAATTILTARSALQVHRETIDLLHLMGATDEQVAGLFQRRIAIDAVIGAAIGVVGAVLILWLIGERVQALGSDLVGSASLAAWSWAVLALLPVVSVFLAMLVARAAILRAMKALR